MKSKDLLDWQMLQNAEQSRLQPSAWGSNGTEINQ